MNNKTMLNKRINIVSVLLCLGLCGCTAGTAMSSNRKSLIKNDWPRDTIHEFNKGIIKVGMNKEQVFHLLGSPEYWTRYEFQEGVFESWFWATAEQSKLAWVASCDFKNGILIGYSGGQLHNHFTTKGCYHTKDKDFDVRDYK